MRAGTRTEEKEAKKKKERPKAGEGGGKGEEEKEGEKWETKGQRLISSRATYGAARRGEKRCGEGEI